MFYLISVKKPSPKILRTDCQSNLVTVLRTHRGQQLSVFRWFTGFENVAHVFPSAM